MCCDCVIVRISGLMLDTIDRSKASRRQYLLRSTCKGVTAATGLKAFYINHEQDPAKGDGDKDDE